MGCKFDDLDVQADIKHYPFDTLLGTSGLNVSPFSLHTIIPTCTTSPPPFDPHQLKQPVRHA